MKFDNNYNYKELKIIIVKELFFSFPKLKPFTNSIYNTLVRKEKELLIILSTPSVTYSEAKDNNSDYFLFTSSDDYTPSFWKLSKIYSELIKYDLVAQHITFSSIIQSEIHEPLSYNKII